VSSILLPTGEILSLRYYYYVNVIVPLVIIVLPNGQKSRKELKQKNESANVKEEETKAVSKDI